MMGCDVVCIVLRVECDEREGERERGERERRETTGYEPFERARERGIRLARYEVEGLELPWVCGGRKTNPGGGSLSPPCSPALG